MSDETTFRLPKTIEDIQAITHVPTTEATESFGRFVNKYLTNADNFTPLTPEQAWAVIGCHRVWQSSDERKAEIAARKEAVAAEAEERKTKRAAEKEARDAEKAAKAEAKAKKDAEKAAKAADDDSDLEDTEAAEESLDEAEEKPAAPKRRRRAAVPAGEF